MINLVDKKYIHNIFLKYTSYIPITLYMSFYIIIIKMSNLTHVGKILEPFGGESERNTR